MKKIAKCLLVLGIVAQLLVPFAAANTASFSDVPVSFWAYNQIEKAVAEGITNGYADGTFKPAGTMTNAHFGAFLARAFYKGEYDPKANTDGWFGYKGQWFDAHEKLLIQKGILNGTKLYNTYFYTLSLGAHINQPISRYDMCQMMYNLLEVEGAKMPSSSEMKAAQSKIGDWNKIPSNYRDPVAACYAMGVLNGQSNGTFGGDNAMNRAQGCVVIYRLRDYIENGSVGGTTTNPGTSTDPGTTPEQPGNDTPVSTERTLTNGKAITPENVQAMIENDIMTKYPEGMSWPASKRYSSPSVFARGLSWTGGCDSYAHQISDEIFGKDAPMRSHKDYKNIRPGDIVISYNASGKELHASVARTLPMMEPVDVGGFFRTADSSGGSNGTVAYIGFGRAMDYYQDNLVVVWTRYPD